ncbi:PIN domain protein [Pseudobythopirellula maris]|uniref:PIN domain protein n=1 Tax=Pseudobythopirellula maris TaxID=2527991 RepID=A0A5C5ZMX7_9BACT|nr:PIN domain-containing protein [Pseudobythopirellula maris]TWT88832.1 PIN domain protein [Pseudobythopirellula maris]
MTVLVDTNVLLRVNHDGHPQSATAQETISRLINTSHDLRTVPQVLYEYWAVATRPVESNGLGFPSSVANRWLVVWGDVFPTFRDERGVLDEWWRLVVDHEVSGKTTHDARLVAAMIRHSVTHLLTFNVSDFKRYDEIVVFSPDAYLAGEVRL